MIHFCWHSLLLQKNQKWIWGSSQAKAFKEVKYLLQSSRVLVHFDDTLPLALSGDASPYSHIACPMGTNVRFPLHRAYSQQWKRSFCNWRKKHYRLSSVYASIISTSMVGDSNSELTTNPSCTLSLKISLSQQWPLVGFRDGLLP